MDKLKVKGIYNSAVVSLKDIANKKTLKNINGTVRETFTNSAENGIVSQSNFFDRTITNDKNISGYYIVDPDDFVYNPRISTFAPVGPINRNKLGRQGVVSPLYLVFSVHDVVPEYLEWYFKSNVWHKFMRENGNTGARSDRFSISDAEFFSMPILLPPINMQKTIAKTLTSLDSKIASEKTEVEKLKALKSAMLDKMFPKDGETVPEIRLKGFSGEWERMKFADFTWAAGRRNSENLDYEAYSITNEHGFIAQNDAHAEFGYMKDTDRTAYKIVESNSFAYNPARINVGSIGFYEGSKNVIVSSLYEVFKTADYINDRFLWYWLKSPAFTKWIYTLQEGSVRLYFYYDKLCECSLLVPSYEEQTKIANTISNIDPLISLHQRKYEKLIDVKKAMLEKLIGGES